MFYGPFNCYSFYRNGICINILNLVQRQDWYITITKEFSEDQNYIKSGQEIDSYYAYHLELLAAKIREDLELNGEVFGNKV